MQKDFRPRRKGRPIYGPELRGYAVMALPRNTQSKTVVIMESGKSAFAGERSSQRNCLSNSS